MNSVMDMNKTLTLASNERIPLKPHMRMLFEMRDLAHASLATVTRAGVLYVKSTFVVHVGCTRCVFYSFYFMCEYNYEYDHY
jgi:hypothetical protein